MLNNHIDIAIVNYHAADEVEQSLELLGEWTHGTVWLIDNSVCSAQADQLAAVCRNMPWVNLIVNAMNLGFGAGCNLAFAQSNANFFLLLNPDAKISSCDVLELAVALESNSKLAAVSPVTFWNDDKTFCIPHTIRQSPRALCESALASWSSEFARFRSRRHIENMQAGLSRDVPFEVDFLTGAILMLRRKAAQTRRGIFDPAFFMFYEDTDLSVRLRRAGYRLAIVPTAQAIHHYRHRPFKESLMTVARQTYFSKHHTCIFHLTRKLSFFDACTVPIDPSRYFLNLEEPLLNSLEFGEATQYRGIVAFSPLLEMVPAIFRAASKDYSPFNAAEWELLGPGRYCALLKAKGARGIEQEIVFRKQ